MDEIPYAYSRRAAKALGFRQYNDGHACSQGHHVGKRTSTGKCLQCSRDAACRAPAVRAARQEEKWRLDLMQRVDRGVHAENVLSPFEAMDIFKATMDSTFEFDARAFEP